MSKDLLNKGMIFLAGGVIGSIATWKLVKTKSERRADDEIASMREYYRNKYKFKTKEVDTEICKDSVEKLNEKVQQLGYKTDKDDMETEDEEDMGRPYVIPPGESWEQDYPTLTLTYYEGDQILANDRNEIIDNIDELVGEDFAEHFGEYEDDSVYICNDNMQVYYEILRDYGKYSESE